MIWRGLLIGIAVAAPIGPNALLCITRALERGKASGFTSGLGSATAHAIYSGLALAGLTALTGAPTRLVGGCLLVLLGARRALRPPSLETRSDRNAAPLRVYGSALAVALGNPMTIAAVGALFSAAGAQTDDVGTALLAVGGVFVGSALWWGALSVSVVTCCRRLGVGVRQRINQLSAGAMTGIGVLALARSG